MALFFLFMLDKEGTTFYAVKCLGVNRYVWNLLADTLFCRVLFTSIFSYSSWYLLVLHVQFDKESTVEAKFKKLENETSGSFSGSSMITLANNTDLLACKAEYYHQCCEYQKCFELTSA